MGFYKRDGGQGKGEGVTMIKGLRHLAIIVSEEKSVAFYKVLGFEETFRTMREYDEVVMMDGHGMTLMLFVDPKHPERADNPENLGLRNLAFKVDQLESSMEEVREAMKEAGFEIEYSPICTNWLGCRYVFFRDPDGQPIGLHE